MNLLLLENTDFIDDNHAVINDWRAQHIQNILKKQVGDTLSAGKINQNIGTATISAIKNGHIHLHTAFDCAPNAALKLTMVLALPRPLMLKRILASIAELGIKELHLIHSQKVEKSYWQSPVLKPSAIDEQLKLGLMQAKDTLLPQVHLHPRFKHFAEDALPAILSGKQGFIAHPYSQQRLGPPSSEPRLIIIGPEGGFNDFEVQLFERSGVQSVNIGQRIYKVETAVTLLTALISCQA